MLIDTDNMLSVTDANRIGISKLISDAESGHDRVLMRNNKPVVAVVSMARLESLTRLEALQDDLELVALALGRSASDNGNRTDLDDVLVHFGLTREDLTDD
jgi:hypothetical protein